MPAQIIPAASPVFRLCRPSESLVSILSSSPYSLISVSYTHLMWNFKNMKLPWYWKVEQQITTIDGSTFPMYYTNMKSLLAEMIRKSEMIIFNRCDGIKDLNVYKRNIKAVNPAADVIFEDSNGEIDEIFEEDLPYDLNQDPIVLDNQGYGIWYLDSMDHLERYVGKNIQFLAIDVYKRQA